MKPAGQGRVAVIGAGIRGLVSAGYLKRRGYSVRIFDQADSPGDIWRHVYASSVLNTPAHGFTFHPGNIWQANPTPRNEILANIDRLVADDALGPLLCLDTSGFGFGSSSIHAKMLDSILSHGLRQPFDASSFGCDCDAEPSQYGPHIICSAMRFLLAQPGSVKILRRLVAEGLRSNIHRFRTAQEPRWVSLLSFLNAPLGL